MISPILTSLQEKFPNYWDWSMYSSLLGLLTLVTTYQIALGGLTPACIIQSENETLPSSLTAGVSQCCAGYQPRIWRFESTPGPHAHWIVLYVGLAVLLDVFAKYALFANEHKLASVVHTVTSKQEKTPFLKPNEKLSPAVYTKFYNYNRNGSSNIMRGPVAITTLILFYLIIISWLFLLVGYDKSGFHFHLLLLHRETGNDINSYNCASPCTSTVGSTATSAKVPTVTTFGPVNSVNGSTPVSPCFQSTVHTCETGWRISCYIVSPINKQGFKIALFVLSGITIL
eukprot:m.205992 g.205992  ORF g.205992 m.205992 type:complete len:286 (-) comp15793_c1_seq1:617-1474(-)